MPILQASTIALQIWVLCLYLAMQLSRNTSFLVEMVLSLLISMVQRKILRLTYWRTLTLCMLRTHRLFLLSSRTFRRTLLLRLCQASLRVSSTMQAKIWVWTLATWSRILMASMISRLPTMVLSISLMIWLLLMSIRQYLHQLLHIQIWELWTGLSKTVSILV